MDERIAPIRERLASAIELANEGGPGLSQPAQDIAVLLEVLDEALQLNSWQKGYNVGYANGETDTQLQAYEEAQS